MTQTESAEAIRMEERAALYRKRSPEADRWAVGYGSIRTVYLEVAKKNGKNCISTYKKESFADEDLYVIKIE
ncbi:hypothetical protein LCGC14_2463870 [marine sediment metagenome]|uniref:Uncharacterized protein n=1 Tax=marine sediment metagenome TaxID=412755 RepID=A0A0F9BCF1_9ZZZZ